MKDLSSLFPAYLVRLFADAAAPKWAIAGVFALLEYVAPHTAPRVLMATCGLVVLDTITGAVRAKVTHQIVSSAKLTRFVTKSFTYAAALVVIALGCDAIPDTAGMHAGIVTGILTGISITELKSNFENLHAIRPDLWGTIAESISRWSGKTKAGS